MKLVLTVIAVSLFAGCCSVAGKAGGQRRGKDPVLRRRDLTVQDTRVNLPDYSRYEMN